MNKVYDCFMFFNELDLLEIRLNILDPYVDFFVLGEAVETFSGKPKPLWYDENKKRFAKWEHKILHRIIGKKETDSSFERAYYQKGALQDALTHLDDADIVYFGDLDEIWQPQMVDDKVYKIKQLNYCYYLNQRSSEEWIGTIVGRWGTIKQGNFNVFRGDPMFYKTGGWHFTNMGGIDQIEMKLDAYDHQEYNTEENKAKINERIREGKDYVGRSHDWQGNPFTFWKDESNWPQYLKDHKEKYQHLCL